MNNLILHSKTLTSMYDTIPLDYTIKYEHFALELELTQNEYNEYKLIESDFENIKDHVPDSCFKIYFSNVKTYKLFFYNTNIIKKYSQFIYLRIHNNIDLKDLQKFNKNKINLIINQDDIFNINHLNSMNIIIQYNSIKELSADTLVSLMNNYNIIAVCVGQVFFANTNQYWINYLNYQAEQLNISNNYDKQSYCKIEKEILLTNDIYNISTYNKIENRLKDIIYSVNIKNEDSEFQKFQKIYKYIINNFHFANSSFNDNLIENQTLLGGLFNNTCVCEGYSKVLQQLLEYVGIQSNIVMNCASKQDGGHLWNQVMIDNVWYNADSVADCENIRMGHPIQKCLVSDEYLLSDTSFSYKTESIIANKCFKNYIN
jgi:hypothetical protein